MSAAPHRICFVCSGNICRSPTAEVVLSSLAADAGIADLLDVDSAGMGDWHVGEEMDRRSRATLSAAGYDVPPHTAQQFTADMFAGRDLVVALDRGHRDELRELAGRTADPQAARAKIVLLREFDPQLAPGEVPEVGDPYYGGERGFADVLEQIERSCARLLATVTGRSAQQAASPPR